MGEPWMVRLRLIASACGRRRPLIAGGGNGWEEPLMEADRKPMAEMKPVVRKPEGSR